MKFLRDLIIEAFFAIWERLSRALERRLDEGRVTDALAQADTEEKKRAVARDLSRTGK